MKLFRELRSLPRAISVVFVATLVNRAGTMALPFLVVYLTKERQLPAETAGAVLGFYGAGALLAGPLAGLLVNRVGARAVMIGSLCGSGMISMAIPWIEDEILGALVVFAWALTAEAFRPAGAAVVAEHALPAQRRTAYAVLRLAVNLGMSIGPAIAGLLATQSYAAIFVIDGATSLLAVAPLLRNRGCLASTGPGEGAHAAAGKDADLAGRGHLGELVVHLVGVALIAVVAYQGLSTLPLYMTSTLALGEAEYGFVFALSGVLIVLFEIPLTLRLGHWTHRRLLFLGTALTGVGFAALAVSTTLFAIVGATLVWTVGEMLLGPAAAARVADLEPPRRRGLYVGLYNAVWSGAFAFGPWLGIQSFAHLGPAVHWLVVGATGLAAATIFVVRTVSRASRVERTTA